MTQEKRMTLEERLKMTQDYKLDQLKLAKKIFEGKRIKQVRYATEKETEDLGWSDDVMVFETEDGTLFYPSMDSEGNDLGVMFVQEALDGPVMFHQF
jgi:LPS O-antigen subunit length determinant protein (WzzB/FepE family)